MGADDVHTMSDALREVVLCSKELVKLTRGSFDPSVAPLLGHYEDMARRSVAASATVAGSGDANGAHHGPTPLASIAERSDSTTIEDGNDDEVDAETIRRQRLVVDYWRSLLSAGFAGDPSDARVSRTVRRLLEVGQWSSAFSVGVVKDDAGNSGSVIGSMHSATSSEVTIRKKHVDARLDLSGIAKGWACDKIAEALPSPCYVEWGGDVKVRGKHPSGRPWVVAVPEPPILSDLRRRVAKAKKAGQVGPVFTLADEHHKAEEDKVGQKEYLAILELRDGEAVATSGDYESELRHYKITLHTLWCAVY
jgi:hypothetical protein